MNKESGWTAKVVAIVATTGLLVMPGLSTPAALAAGASITIADPGSPSAGTVTLRGAVSPGTTGTTGTPTVLYVMDASGSTKNGAGSDCNGDRSSTSADDLNGDGSVGDTLDCEIAAINAVDASLVGSSPGLMTGLEAFSERAAAADLDPSPASAPPFIPAGFTGGDVQPRLRTVANSVHRTRILQFTDLDLGGRATNLGLAVNTALDTLAAAPAGPKLIILVSDGSGADDALPTTRLQASGVKLRSFAISSNPDACDGGSGLAALAGATGETCHLVANPAALATSLTSSQPDSIADVSVTVGGLTVRADVDPVGGWTAAFSIGPGSYTASATALLSSGAVVSTTRPFTVGPAAPGASAPPPGVVRPGPGSLIATGITARRPRPHRALLPASVSGAVGLASPAGLKSTRKLNGATVVLQGRAGAGTTWTTVGRTKVVGGNYTVTWKRVAKIKALRVQLRSFAGLAPSPALAVPVAKISHCTVKKVGARKQLTCHTTVKAGTKVRLLNGDRVLDRTRVRGGLITVTSTRPFTGDVLSVDLTPRRHIRLSL